METIEKNELEYSLQNVIDYGIESLILRLNELNQTWQVATKSQKIQDYLGKTNVTMSTGFPKNLHLMPALLPLVDALSGAARYAAAGEDVTAVIEQLVATYDDWVKQVESKCWTELGHHCELCWSSAEGEELSPLKDSGEEACGAGGWKRVWHRWEGVVDAVRLSPEPLGPPWLREARLLHFALQVLPDALSQAWTLNSRSDSFSTTDTNLGSQGKLRAKLQKMENLVAKLRAEKAMLNESLYAAEKVSSTGSLALEAKMRAMEASLQEMKEKNRELLYEMHKAESKANRALQAQAAAEAKLKEANDLNAKLKKKLRLLKKNQQWLQMQQHSSSCAGHNDEEVVPAVQREKTHQDKGEATEETSSSGPEQVLIFHSVPPSPDKSDSSEYQETIPSPKTKGQTFIDEKAGDSQQQGAAFLKLQNSKSGSTFDDHSIHSSGAMKQNLDQTSTLNAQAQKKKLLRFIGVEQKSSNEYGPDFLVSSKVHANSTDQQITSELSRQLLELQLENNKLLKEIENLKSEFKASAILLQAGTDAADVELKASTSDSLVIRSSDNSVGFLWALVSCSLGIVFSIALLMFKENKLL